MPIRSRKSLCYGALSFLILGLSLFILLAQTPSDSPSSAQAQIKHWQISSHFQQARRAFAASTNGRHIYVVGGIDAADHYLASVEFAAILPDGSLGPWQAAAPMNEGRFYLATAIIGDYLYAVGGANGPLGEDNIPSATAERARILPSGELGPWEQQPYMTSPRRGLQVVSYKNYIFALGGFNGQFLKTVERAEVNAQGVITHWQAINDTFVVDRYIHSAAIHNNRIYLIAGHVEKQNKLSYNDVESALISESGELSPWRIEKSHLRTPRFIASAISSGNVLYIAGGHDGANRLSSVESALIEQDGTLGAWQENLPLATPRSATALVSHNRILYILGGGGGSNVLASVESSIQLPGGKLTATRFPSANEK